MKIYTLMDYLIKEDYSETYRKFTYEMYALCKRNGCIIDFLDSSYDRYCDPQMDYNSPEELAGFTLDNVDSFIAVVGNESQYPRNRVDWALNRDRHREMLFVLVNESEEDRSAPISKDSLKYKLYFEEKMYTQSYDYNDELTFWIAIHIMNMCRLSPDIIKVKDDLLFFDDVFIGYISRIPAIHHFREYRNAEERGADPNRVAADIIKVIAFVLRIQSERYHEQFRDVMYAQLRGDNIGVSLMINHESLREEIAEAFERYKASRRYEDKEQIYIILTKMQLGLLNSYLINYADENRDEYAEELKKDINKYYNHLNKFKS